MQVICISGKAEAGKTTVGDMIHDELKFTHNKSVLFVNYGDVLKYVAKEWFDWDGIKDDAGRTLLQQLGTDKVRAQYPNFWSGFVQKLVNCFRDMWDYVIIGDCRFSNEITGWLSYDIVPIWLHVERPSYTSSLNTTQLMHSSEQGLLTQVDSNPALRVIHHNGFYTIDNDSTLITLRTKVQRWVATELPVNEAQL